MAKYLSLLTTALLWLLTPAVGRSAEIVFRTIDGGEYPAPTISLSGTKVKVSTGGNARDFELGELLTAEVRGIDLPPRDDDVALLLVDGSRVHGRLGESDEDAFHLDSRGLGVVAIPIDFVAVVAIGPPSSRIDPTVLLPTGKSAEDVVYRAGKAQGDSLRGTLIALGRDGGIIDTELGEISIERSAIQGVTIATTEADPFEPVLPIELELVDDGRLRAGLIGLTAGQVTLSTCFSKRLVLPIERIRRIRFSSESVTYLSDLVPVEVEEIPYIGDASEFLFPWRADQSVTGGALEVAGRRFGKGLGLHSRSKLTFDVAGFESFVAKVGVSDEVLTHPLQGGLEIRFLVDGEVRFESGMLRAGGAAVPVEISLKGGRRLTVVVDFGELGDVGDRAVIGDPLLLTES